MSREPPGHSAGCTTHDNRTRGRPHATWRRTAGFLLGVLVAAVLNGCGGSGEPGESSSAVLPPAPVSPPAPVAQARHGRYIGTVTIDDRDYFGDALFTVDGLVRLYIGGPYVSDGTVEASRPASSAQFTGSIAVEGDRASGSGVIIGQGCAATDTADFCGELVSGEIRVAFAGSGLDSGEIQGELRVTTEDGEETWSLELAAWSSFYALPATVSAVAGQYREELAEFAQGEVIINVDSAGQLVFQDAESGCIGHGGLAPHPDGEFNIYDVTLTIDGCSAAYAHLIGEYGGLATQSPSGYWDYDSWLRIWLSTRDGTPSQTAVTTWGRLL